MYWSGVIYSSFVIGFIVSFLLGRWLFLMAVSFVKDSEYNRPWPFTIPWMPDGGDDAMVVFVTICFSTAVVFAWPLSLLVAIIAATLHSLRFAVRTCKKLNSLKEKSHEHPESVEQSQSKFSW